MKWFGKKKKDDDIDRMLQSALRGSYIENEIMPELTAECISQLNEFGKRVPTLTLYPEHALLAFVGILVTQVSQAGYADGTVFPEEDTRSETIKAFICLTCGVIAAGQRSGQMDDREAGALGSVLAVLTEIGSDLHLRGTGKPKE